MKHFLRVGLVAIWIGFVSDLALAERSQDLIELARSKTSERFEFALEHDAKIIPTPDRRSFFLLWKPDVGAPEQYLVTLHGHGSWATDDFYVWYPFLKDRKIGLIAIQWWFGGGEETKDYYDPKSLYQQIALVLKNENVNSGQAILHGFSRGSANSYAVAYEDRKSGNNYFGYVISNSGGMMSDYPPNRAIEQDPDAGNIYSEIQWIFFCGAQDPNPNRDGCIAMRKASEWVVRHGAQELLFIEDPNGSHGGFHRNPENAEKALNAMQPKG